MNKKRVIKLQCPFERIKKYSNNREASLYKAVIMQMIIDASNISSNPSSVSREKEAKEWLFTQNEDFYFTCSMAGIPHKIIINLAQDLIKMHHSRECKKANAVKSGRGKNKIFFSM